MSEYMKDWTLQAFSDQTASGEPVPGGGSISALAGALAASLTQMVAGLTLGKKKYADAAEEMEKIIPGMDALRRDLLDDVTRDSASFDQFMQALAMPKETEAEKDARRAAMQDGLKAAVMTPLDVARKSAGVLPLARAVVERGNATALSDGLVAAMMARSAVKGAAYNVRINLNSIQDEEFVTRIRTEIGALEREAQEQEEEILALAETLLEK